MKCRPTVAWRVLYLFAGPRRWPDLGEALKAAVDAWNSDERSFTIELGLDECDARREEAAHGLGRAGFEAELLERFYSGRYELIVGAPPFDVFSKHLLRAEEVSGPRRATLEADGGSRDELALRFAVRMLDEMVAGVTPQAGAETAAALDSDGGLDFGPFPMIGPISIAAHALAESSLGPSSRVYVHGQSVTLDINT